MDFFPLPHRAQEELYHLDASFERTCHRDPPAIREENAVNKVLQHCTACLNVGDAPAHDPKAEVKQKAHILSLMV